MYEAMRFGIGIRIEIGIWLVQAHRTLSKGSNMRTPHLHSSSKQQSERELYTYKHAWLRHAQSGYASETGVVVTKGNKAEKSFVVERANTGWIFGEEGVFF